MLSAKRRNCYVTQRIGVRLRMVKKCSINKAALDNYVEGFVVHMTSLLTIMIYPAKKAQIVLLIAKKVKISTEYLDFSDDFLKEKVLILLEVSKMN